MSPVTWETFNENLNRFTEIFQNLNHFTEHFIEYLNQFIPHGASYRLGNFQWESEFTLQNFSKIFQKVCHKYNDHRVTVMKSLIEIVSFVTCTMTQHGLDAQPLTNNCTIVMVWHTKTHTSKGPATDNDLTRTKKFKNSNLATLLASLWSNTQLCLMLIMFDMKTVSYTAL